METILQLHQSPMAQFIYDATYEHHETHLEPLEPETSETFMDWINTQRMKFTTDNPGLLPFLNACYYKTLECSIYHRSMGIEISDLQLIVLCNRMLNS